MDTFLQFITESFYDFDQRYQYFNHRLFANGLPTVPITRKRLATVSGRCILSTTGRGYMAIAIPGTIRIEVNNTLNYAPEQLDRILVHEMIHVHFFHVGDLHEEHGSKFRAMALKFSQELGFEIPLKDDIQDVAISDDVRTSEVGMVLKHDEAKNVYSCAFFGKTRWLAHADRIKSSFIKRGQNYAFHFGKTNLHRKFEVSPPKGFAFFEVSPADAHTIMALPKG